MIDQLNPVDTTTSPDYPTDIAISDRDVDNDSATSERVDDSEEVLKCVYKGIYSEEVLTCVYRGTYRYHIITI
jgi:hypothetical protein